MNTAVSKVLRCAMYTHNISSPFGFVIIKTIVDHLNGADDAMWSAWRGIHGN
jgi:hypothetical protein